MADPFAAAPATPPPVLSSRSHASFGITGLPTGSVVPKAVRKKPPPDPNKPKKERKRKEPPTPTPDGSTEQEPKKRKTTDSTKKPSTPRPKTPGPSAPATPTYPSTPTTAASDADDAEELSQEDIDEEEVLYSEAELQRREERARAGDDESSDEEENEDDDMELDEAEQTQEKATRMHELITQFNEDQLVRYETYRRSKLPQGAVKKIMLQSTGTVAPVAGIVMAGISKLFVGELVELGRVVQEEWAKSGVEPMTGDNLGPLKPIHLREAYRRLKAEGKLPYVKPERLFKR